MKVRTFAETYSQAGSTWREVKTPIESEGTLAAVYINGGVPMAAFFTIQTESGDWVLFAEYYFRPDGTLAMRHEQLNTFIGNAMVIRDRYWGCRGEAYGGATRHLDLDTQKQKKPDPDFDDHRAPLFKRVQDLPFFSALSPRN